MNVSMPSVVRALVTQAAIRTAAHERAPLDDSAWIVRAVCEKLSREWDRVGRGPLPDAVRERSGQSLAASADPRTRTAADAWPPA